MQKQKRKSDLPPPPTVAHVIFQQKMSDSDDFGLRSPTIQKKTNGQKKVYRASTMARVHSSHSSSFEKKPVSFANKKCQIPTILSLRSPTIQKKTNGRKEVYRASIIARVHSSSR